jgi:hypothetical protein
MEFSEFVEDQQRKFEEASKDESVLFATGVKQDELWSAYLDSFPPGMNEVYRERREFDCSHCRHGVYRFGNVVMIKDNQLVSIWDMEVDDERLGPVVNKMSSVVKSHHVVDVFVSKESKLGQESSNELQGDGAVRTWSHFSLTLPDRLVYTSDKSEAQIRGGYRDTKNVFKRSLEEIDRQSIVDVLDMIEEKSLYKGDEWEAVLTRFLGFQNEYNKLPDNEKDNYCWIVSTQVGSSVSKLRNHSMGTLLVNLSDGMEPEVAVKKFEAIVAPSNYKRPKAIFTAGMIQRAEEAVTELGFVESLGRRYANLDDISINNVLWANRDAAKRMDGAGGAFDMLREDVTVDPKKFESSEPIGVDDFIGNVITSAGRIEVLVENRHEPNLVSLIAPVVEDSPTMFKWGNSFSWAYGGNVADSMRERVHSLGGRVDGALRFTHSWNHTGQNQSLMDLHVFFPGYIENRGRNGTIHDYYPGTRRVGWNLRRDIQSGAEQDVDFVQRPGSSVPLENISFPDIRKMPEGRYTFCIHNWSARNPNTSGFVAEIEFGGDIHEFNHPGPLKNKEWVTLATVDLKDGKFSINPEMDMSGGTTSREMWGINTSRFHPVSSLMFSPNYWDEQDGIGNLHVMFMIAGCINDSRPNGFFNEYLKPELETHRRVFEALGSKMKVEESENQLSGLGFSSTQRNYLICRVDEKPFKVVF